MRQTRHSSKYYYPRGFTLIEVMVVVVILGILATIVIPKLVSRPEQARMVKAKQDILGLQSALDLYRLDNRFYPSTDQGLTALVKEPSSEPKPPYWKQYLRKLPKDPWGNPAKGISMANRSVRVSIRRLKPKSPTAKTAKVKTIPITNKPISSSIRVKPRGDFTATG